MEIKRESNFFELYDYDFIEGEKTLSIYMGPDACIHFFIKNKQNEKSLEETFTITKENKVLYDLFRETYEAIRENNLYESSKEEIASCNCAEDYSLLKQKEYNILVQGQSVTWYSESDNYKNATHFTMRVNKDSIDFHFKKKDIPNKRRDFIGGKRFLDVRIGIRDSHFFPFNIAFKKLYDNLQSINPDYHKIEMEDLYLKKKKDTE